MLYSSIENKKIKELKKLNQKKYRDKQGLFLAPTPHLVEEAEKANCLKEILILENETIDTKVPTNEVTPNVMKHLTNLETIPKVIGICEKKQEEKIGNKVLMLDSVQDPGNLGTIIRSATAFNIDTIIINDKTADIYSEKVIRASQGMIFKINIITKNLEETIINLKKQDYKILGTKVTSGKELKNLEKNKKFVIIMGNEGNGVSEELLNMCDEYLYIPMNSNCESLNVAVATSIILYEISR